MDTAIEGDSKSIFKYNDYADVDKTWNYYWDMADNYHNGNININNYPIKTRLITYGITQQAKFGDVPSDMKRPPIWQLPKQVKYDHWAEQKGRPRTDARKDFIQLTEAFLAVQGDDADKKKQGQEYLDSVKAIMNKDVNPGLVDETLLFRDDDHVKEWLSANRDVKYDYGQFKEEE